MPLRRFSPGLKAQFAFGMVFLFVQPDVSAAAAGAQQIGGVIIPQAFSRALQDGMSVPLYIHLAGSQGIKDDQRIGSAFIWLDGGQLRVRQIRLEEVPSLLSSGVIGGGMIPKIQCCVNALEHGVHRTHILDGRIPHTILTEMLSHQGIGTMLWE